MAQTSGLEEQQWPSVGFGSLDGAVGVYHLDVAGRAC
jgi:hypothetical protein